MYVYGHLKLLLPSMSNPDAVFNGRNVKAHGKNLGDNDDDGKDDDDNHGQQRREARKPELTYIKRNIKQ